MLNKKDFKKIKERVSAKVEAKLAEYKANQEEAAKKKVAAKSKQASRKAARTEKAAKTRSEKAAKAQLRKDGSAAKAARQNTSKRKTTRRSAAADTNTVKENKLELLITIVNRSKAEYYVDLLQSFDVNLQFVELGRGTADENMLSAFGLSDSDKAVIFSVIQENRLPDALLTLEKKFDTIKNGKGIAYTLPLSGVIGTLIFGFLSNNRKAVKETK